MPPLHWVTTADGPMRYAQAGEGGDVLLLHGAMTSVEDMLLGPFDALARRFRVTAVDRPGHGATRRRRLGGAPSRQARQVLAAIAALGIERATVVGQSFGAAVAMDLALAAPHAVRGVVAISPIAFPEWRLEHLLYGPRALPGAGDLIAYGPGRVLDALLLPALWPAMFAPQPMPLRFRQEYPFALASGADQMLALGEEAMLAIPDLAGNARRYPSCEVPVAVLAGSADWLAPPWTHAARLAGAVPDASLRLLPGLGHMLHHFAVAEIVEAIDELDAQAPQAPS
jgi:pimeloyl-ACP methyl ester carboxylesterase